VFLSLSESKLLFLHHPQRRAIVATNNYIHKKLNKKLKK